MMISFIVLLPLVTSISAISLPVNCYKPLFSAGSYKVFYSGSVQQCINACNLQPNTVAAEFGNWPGYAGAEDCWCHPPAIHLESPGPPPRPDFGSWTTCLKEPFVVVPFTCVDNTSLDNRSFIEESGITINRCQNKCNAPTAKWCSGIGFSEKDNNTEQGICKLYDKIGNWKSDDNWTTCFKGSIPTPPTPPPTTEPPTRIYVVETTNEPLNISELRNETAARIQSILNTMFQMEKLKQKGNVSILVTGSAGSGKTTTAIQLCDYVTKNIKSFENVEIRRFLRERVSTVDEFKKAIETSLIVIIDEFLYWKKDALGEQMLGYLMKLLTPKTKETIKRFTIFTGYENGYRVMANHDPGWERRLNEIVPVVPLKRVVAKCLIANFEKWNISIDVTDKEISNSTILEKIAKKYGFGIVSMVHIESVNRHANQPRQIFTLDVIEEILESIMKRRPTRAAVLESSLSPDYSTPCASYI